MLPDEIKKFLFDIKTAIESINEYLGVNKDFNKYKSDKMLRRAIEREFEIIGEAMTRLDRIDPDLQISSKKLIIGMRNRVIHGYDKIDDEIIWGTIIRHLPILKEEISSLIEE